MEFDKKQDDESQWLPISDLMSVLMMVFLLIAISFMVKVYLEKEKIEEVAVTYNKLQNELFDDLQNEFESELVEWNAEIDSVNLSVKFKSPDILFNLGSSRIKPKFKEILSDFFPRFISILYSDKYRDEIEEIRIEGHTSSFWSYHSDEYSAYINNMELSQDRTRQVLAYVLQIENDVSISRWTKGFLTANGLSSSKLITNQDGSENRESSRRVEFRIKTNAEQQIARILTQ